MKFSLSSRERAAGLFLVGSLCLVVVFFIGAAVRNRWFAPRIAYHTVLARGDGLHPGSPVLLAGVEVGEIGSIVITEDDRVHVELIVWAEHAKRIRTGIRAVPRRMLGIGDKRVHLVPQPGPGGPLPHGALIAAQEPVEILDLLETIDFGQYLRTLDRTMASFDKILALLEQDGRLDKLFATLDRLGPLLAKLDKLLDDTAPPLTALLQDPALAVTLQGTATLLNDPALHGFLRGGAAALDRGRMDKLLGRADSAFERLDRLTAEDGHLMRILGSADKVMGEGRADRLVASLERLADDKRSGAMLDHLAVLAEQMARVGPEIPTIAKDLHGTLREAVVVLKALQNTWMLGSESRKAREQLKEAPEAAPAPVPAPTPAPAPER